MSVTGESRESHTVTAPSDATLLAAFDIAIDIREAKEPMMRAEARALRAIFDMGVSAASLRLALDDADAVRAHMEAAHVTQQAFVTAEGQHVLVQIDRDDDIGLISPDDLIGWKYLARLDDIWPLTVLS